MASKIKTTSVVEPSYVDFEPYCEWQREEGVDTLVVHLPDFKKDQLRVQVNNLGVLKVSGERTKPEDGNRRNRFLKETKIPEGCDINDIRAKFIGGRLHIMMPKKPTIVPHQVASNQEVNQSLKEEAKFPDNQNLKAPRNEDVNQTGTITSDGQPKDDMFGSYGSCLSKFKLGKKVNVNYGIAIAIVVAIGIYAAYKCGSCSSSPPNSHIEESRPN